VGVSVLLVLAVLLPALGGLAVRVGGAARIDAAGRATALAAGAAAVAAGVLLVHVAVAAPVEAVLAGADGGALAGLHLDRVGAVLLLLVLAVGAVTQAHARRALRGDVRAAHVLAAAGLLTSATAAMVSAATLVGLATAWSIAGVALCLLLGTYRGLPAADAAVRRTARTFAAGDLALWLAVGVAVLAWGNLDLRTLGAAAPALAADGVVLTVVAVLLVVAALARSAQLPFGRWLPATLAAPTQVSALLHAGVVNAGGVLLVTLAPLFAASAAATHLAFAAGAATAVYGTVLMLARPDVKGALAHSTMGQMGFMVMTCGLGAFAAAIVHLVAHGMFKASLFLGAGGAVDRLRRHRAAPPAARRAPTAGTAAAAVLVPGAALAGAAALVYPTGTGATAGAPLLLFAWATAAWAAWAWLARARSPRALAALAGATVAAAFAYVALLAAATAFLRPALDGAGTAVAGPWLLAPLAAVLVLAALVRHASAAAGSPLAGLHRTAYVLALTAGATGPRRLRGVRPPRAVPAPAPVRAAFGGAELAGSRA